MMKKQILQEINRIHEIMGLESEKNLLLEQPKFWDDLIKGAREFWDKLSKSPNSYNNPTLYKVGNVEIPPNIYTKLKKFLAEPYSMLSELTEIESYWLGKILSQDVNKVEQLYQSQIRKTMSKTKASEEELLESIYKKARTDYSGDLRLALSHIFSDEQGQINNASELLSGILFSKIKNRIYSLGEDFKIEVFPIESVVKNWIKNNEPAIMKAFREIYFSWVTSFKKKDKDFFSNKIREIESKMQEKLSRVTDEGNPDPQAVNREVRELFNFIVSKKLSGQDNVAALIKLNIDDNPKIPQEVKDELNNMGYVKEIKKRLNKDIVNTTANQFLEAIQANLESFPLAGALLRPIALKIKDRKYQFWNEWLADYGSGLMRFINQAAYKSPFSLDEALARSIGLGRTATFVEKVLAYYLVSNKIIPWLLQSAEGLYTNSEIQRLRLIVQTVKEACETGVLNPCPVDELEKLQSYTKEQFDKGMREKMPWLKLVKSIGHGDFFGILKSMTWIDDIYSFLNKIYETSIFGDQKIVDIYMEEIKNANLKIEQKLKEMGVDPNDEAQIEKFRKLLNKTYPNTLEGFQNSFIDAGVSVNTGDCVPLGNGKYTFGGNTFIFKQKNADGTGVFEMQPE